MEYMDMVVETPALQQLKGITLEGHESEVFGCAWNPCCDLLASGSNDSTARIWDLMEKPILTPNPVVLHQKGAVEISTNKDVTSVNWRSDGSFLATGSYDGSGRVWAANGSLTHTLNLHNGPILALKFNSLGNYLASAGADNKTVIWDAESGQPIQQFCFHTSHVLDLDWLNNSTFASCSSDKLIQVCTLNDCDTPLKTFQGHTNEVNAVAWDPQGLLLASCSDDQTLKIWSLKFDTCLRDLREHSKEIYEVKWSPTGPGTQYPNMNVMLASASCDSTVRLWDIEMGVSTNVMTNHSESVYSIAFSPDGKLLASGACDGCVYIWSTLTGCIVNYFKSTGVIFVVSFNSRGDKLAAGSSDGRVFVFNLHYY